MESEVDIPAVWTETAHQPAGGLSGSAHFCMSCGVRRASRTVIDHRGRKQHRCETCFAKKNQSGFNKGKK